MNRRRVAAVSICVLALVGFDLAAQTEGATSEAPAPESDAVDTDLVERTGQKLFQLDVSLRPKDAGEEPDYPELAPTDFRVSVNGSRIAVRYADRVCRGSARVKRSASSAGAATGGDAVEVAAAATPTGGTYLFFIEHKQLTLQGQQHALIMVTDLVEELVRDGSRAMIISSGQRVLHSDLTDDSEVLLAFVRRIRKLPSQWSDYDHAEGEGRRYREVRANPSLARFYQREEILFTRNRLRRLANAMGFMAELDAPKAVLYFADTIRRNAGDHYMRVEAEAAPRSLSPELATMAIDSAAAQSAFDSVTASAGAHGVRLYTVQARGLTAPSPRSPSWRAIRDAETTMVSLALETGGTSFRGGVDRRTINRVVGQIEQDLSCLYLLGFYADDLPQDETLPIQVVFDPACDDYSDLAGTWKIGVRGQIVVQSAEKRRESRLIAAHMTSSAYDDAQAGRGSVIPLGFEDGRYRALIQVAVSSALPEALAARSSWDLGMSHVRQDQVLNQLSKHVELADVRVPLVVEAVWTLPPGRNEVISVAYDGQFGQIATTRQEAAWPDPDSDSVTITPIAIVQPGHGVFLRDEAGQDEQRRNEGTIGIGNGPARVDRPIYAVGLVCRDKRVQHDLWIERRLAGNVSVDFEPQRWRPDDRERCVQIRDLIRDGQLGWGEFEYEVRVYRAPDRGAALARRTREFLAIDPRMTPEEHRPRRER